MNENAIAGCLLGTALGDAVGLPCERLSRKRVAALYKNLQGPQFLGKRGLISDDTEHACLVAQALCESPHDVEQFEKAFACRLKKWFLCGPPGIGAATLKSCARLCAGVSSAKSGVFSAGNGPAMRSALLGVCFGDNIEKLREFVHVSTRITHTDPKAGQGAFAVALAAHYFASGRSTQPTEFLQELRVALPDADEFLGLIEQAILSAQNNQNTIDFATNLELERGVSGYVFHTVPVAIQAAFRHRDNFKTAILETVRCGGDADTVAAIVGAIVGAGIGAQNLPQDWLDRLSDKPRSVKWMRKLAASLSLALTEQKFQKPPEVFAPLSLARNGIFLMLVLGHAARRTLPPY